MASSIVGCNFTPQFRARTLSWNPMPNFVIHKYKYQRCLQGNNSGLQWNQPNKRNFVVKAGSVPPEGPLPSEPGSNSLFWIFGFVATFILPFFSSKWGPLLGFKNKVESTVQTVENIVEAVEEVAGKVDKIVEDIADDLPEGKLKDFAEFVEDMAEKTAKTADGIDNVIDKVQETGENVDDFLESLDKESKVSPKQAN